jgi:hypothetical protein
MRTALIALLFAPLLAFGQTVTTPIKNAKLTGTLDASALSNKSTVRSDLGLALGTDVQPFDSDLSSIAALATTSFGRGLLTESSASTARSTLGLVIGTNVLAPNGSGASLTNLNANNISSGITLPAYGGTGVTAMPKFRVNKAGTTQSIADNTDTLVSWSAEEFDTNANFASNKFTPTVAGKYLLHAQVWLGVFSGFTGYVKIFKNGAEIAAKQFTASVTDNYTIDVTSLVDANGSTDYFEVYARHNDTGNTRNLLGTVERTWFEGTLIP